MRTFLPATLAAVFLAASSASAQYAETPRELPVVNGYIDSAAQIGNRLFVAGRFSRLGPPTGGAVVVDPAGALVPGAFPVFTGIVYQIVPDGLGGYLVVGDFTSAGGHPHARFARVQPDRTIDPGYRVTADGAIRIAVIAHGRIYLVGDFTSINGAPRRGLAVLDAASAQLTPLGAGFNAAGYSLRALSVSSTGIFVSGNRAAQGMVWGFDAGSGALRFERSLYATALAATSERVYVGTFGAARPVLAVDPLTGEDAPWATNLRFVPLYGTYGDYTAISALRLDAGRLYISGYFRTADGRDYLTAVDALTGQALPWRPENAPGPTTGLARVGPAIVATFATGNWPQDVRRIAAFNVDTAAAEAWDPQPYGSIHTLAAATDGVVIGGDFNGMGGDDRSGLASIDLDTGAVEPWTVAGLPASTIFGGLRIVSDGSHIIATHSARTLVKIDAASGAVLAQLDLDMGISLFARVAGGRLVVLQNRSTGEPLLTTISIADWSRQDLPTTFSSPTVVTAVDAAGDLAYIAGSFTGVNGTRRDGLAAVHLSTGALEPWNPSPDAGVNWVRAAGGRVFVAGGFRRVGGAWRRGVADLDPVSGLASAWNPDVPAGFVPMGSDRLGYSTINGMEIGPDGYMYVSISGVPAPTVSGQPVPGGIVALSTVTGRRLAWRSPAPDWAAILPGCLLQTTGCLPPAISAPADLRVEQAGATVTLRWTLPDDEPVRTAVRLEAGTAEGRADLAVFDVPAGQTEFSANLPRGSYAVRVRSVAGAQSSLPTPDVSFAVGPPDVPAMPLDLTAVTEGAQLTLAWRPSSTGVPAGYLFEAGSGPGGREVAVLPLAGAATSLVIDAPAGRYYGRLVPVNAHGRGPASGEVLIDVNVTAAFCQHPPDGPTGLVAQVSGGTVLLSWQPAAVGALPEAQRLVAGTAPGLEDLGAIALGASATTFATMVPPGTYYVRIAAANGCGTSPFSNEVQVVVP